MHYLIRKTTIVTPICVKSLNDTKNITESMYAKRTIIAAQHHWKYMPTDKTEWYFIQWIFHSFLHTCAVALTTDVDLCWLCAHLLVLKIVIDDIRHRQRVSFIRIHRFFFHFKFILFYHWLRNRLRRRRSRLFLSQKTREDKQKTKRTSNEPVGSSRYSLFLCRLFA